jgi:hypothetical protein
MAMAKRKLRPDPHPLLVRGETFTVVHIGDLDPDYRRQPKTSHFCCLCQRDIKTPPAETAYLHYVDGGNAILAVEDEARFSELQDAGDMYSFPVGSECARKLPNGFVHTPTHS